MNWTGFKAKLKKHWYIPTAIGALLLLKGVQPVLNRTLNIEETGNNAGFTDKNFEAALKKLGWQPGWHWCVMYAKYVWSKWLKGAKKLRAMQLISANSQVTYSNFEKDTSGYFEVSKKPQKGSIVIWQRSSTSGHAGIVEKINSDNTFTSIEGNQSDKVTRVKRTYNFTTVNSEGLKLRGFINIK